MTWNEKHEKSINKNDVQVISQIRKVTKHISFIIKVISWYAFSGTWIDHLHYEYKTDIRAMHYETVNGWKKTQYCSINIFRFTINQYLKCICH